MRGPFSAQLAACRTALFRRQDESSDSAKITRNMAFPVDSSREKVYNLFCIIAFFSRKMR